MSKHTFYKVTSSAIIFLFLTYLGSLYIPNHNPVPITKAVDEKVVYLTFDDGPSEHTQAVLDVLDKHKVKATFFVSGQNPDYFPQMRKAHEKHHVIAAHTYSHSFKEIYSSEEAYYKDLDAINDVIETQTGQRSKIVRFPGGSSNTVSRRYSQNIVTTLAHSLETKGYRYYDWNATNGDGGCSRDVNEIVNQAIRESRGKQEVMLLMHDGTCNEMSAQALPNIIEYFKDNGYLFKTIDESVPTFHQSIAN